MFIYSTAFLTLLCAHFQLSLTADLERPTLPINTRRTLDSKESGQSSKKDGSNGRTVDPVFMKNLNENGKARRKIFKERFPAQDPQERTESVRFASDIAASNGYPVPQRQRSFHTNVPQRSRLRRSPPVLPLISAKISAAIRKAIANAQLHNDVILVLMKFLREVANMVKQSPQDVDHVQQVDVSRMLTGSLAASVMDGPASVAPARVMLTLRPPPQPQGATSTPDPVRFLSRRPLPAELSLTTTMRPQTHSVNRLSPRVPANHVVHLETAEVLQTVASKREQQGFRHLDPANAMPPASNHIENSQLSPTRFNTTRLLQRQKTNPSLPRKNEHFTSNKIMANQFTDRRVPPRNGQPRRISGRAQISVRPAQNSKEKVVRVETFKAAARTTAQVFRRRQDPAQPSKTLDIVLKRHRSSDSTQTITQPASSSLMNRNTAPNAGRRQPQVTVDTAKKLIPALDLNLNKMRRANLNRVASFLGRSRLKALLQASSASRLQLRPQQSIANSPKVVAVTTRQEFENQEVPLPTKGISATSAPPILQPHLLVVTTKKLPEPVLPLGSSLSSDVFLYSTTALPRQNRQDSSSREAILNMLIFDLFARLGVRSFVVKTDEGAIEGIADPSRTKFVPVEIVDEPNRSGFQWRKSPLSGRQSREFENGELKTAVAGVSGTPGVIRNRGPTLPRLRLAARNPSFFRDGRRIWRRTNGITRKQLRRALLRNSMA